ncbi:MAG: M56 family metallopeptidase [Edaphobacter sp.]
MTANSLSMLGTDAMRELCNHLWQSTLFAGVVLFLTLTLRKYQARTRYWLWMAASVKLLIPFSLLAVIVSHLKWIGHAGESQTATFTAIHQMSQPFTEVTGLSAPITSLGAPPSSHYPIAPLVLLLTAVWFLGFIAVLAFWLVQWRRVSKSVRVARPLQDGREVEALCRMERIAGLQRPMKIVPSPDSMEPGVFGILRPVLLWPEGISRHLDDAHLEAVLAHEVCHVRWRDNLTSMVHMLVAAIFWFHPLVWWMEKQLVKERELACDEEVVGLCNQPQVYAESILKVCEFCIESPLPCVSGITGADLKKRVKQIMTGQIGLKLGLGRRLLLVGTAVALTLVVPVVLGVVRAEASQTEGAAAESRDLKFEVVSIRQNKSGGPQKFGPTADGYRLTNLFFQMPIVTAYDPRTGGTAHYAPDQISGLPDWVMNDRYDIDAKVAEADLADWKNPAKQREMLPAMLREMLKDRLKLVVHRGTKEVPVYWLTVGKNGPKFKETDPSVPHPGGTEHPGGGVSVEEMRDGHMTGHCYGCSMQLLAWFLSGERTGRPVQDKTGLAGSYDFWLPTTAALDAPATDPSPSVFSVVEGLGLKLVPAKGQVETLVIDHIERPSAN